jgi:hypothetical protein
VIGVFISLLFSPFGVVAALLGFVSFFLIPFIPRITRHFYGFARFHQTLAGIILKRSAIVVSEHGDLLLKRMSYDDAGVEMIGFSDTKKEFEDTNGAKSWWLGMRFGLADEKHGFFFTPRDAATGRRKHEAEEADEMIAKATADERDQYDVMGFVRGVFAFPRDVYELVDLTDVRYLVPGSERAEQPQTVKKFYEISQEPYSDKKTAVQLFLLLGAAIGPFAMVWILATQLGGPDETVSYGAEILLLLSLAMPTTEQVKHGLKLFAIYTAVLLPLPAIFTAIAVYVSPAISVSLLVLFVLGFMIFPAFSQILKASDGAANAMARLLLKLGFMGYDEPVLVQTDSGYETREYGKLPEVSQEKISWHTFLGRKFGFTFTPDESVWDNEPISTDAINNRSEVATDGGKVKQKTNGKNTQTRKISGNKSNIPSGFTRIPERTRAVYGEFVPSRVSDSKLYVHVGRSLERFKHVATGQKSYNRLERAKEEFGGGSGFEERTVAILMAVLSTVSLLLGIGIFLLPSLL